MIIKKAEIIGFGKLISRSFEFGSNLNIIYGNNEAGKSTLQMFLKAMLYGVKTNKSIRTKYSPWESEAYKGILVCEDSKGNEYRIERDFKTGKTAIYNSELVNINTEFIPSSSKKVCFAEKIIDMNEEEFEKTVFIKQFNTEVDKSGKSNMLSKFANVETSGDEDISIDNAIKKLMNIWKTKIGTEKSKKQPINILSNKIIEKKEDIKRIENIRKDLQGKELLLKDTRKQNEVLKEKISILKGLDEWIGSEEKALQKKQKVTKLLLLKKTLKAKDDELLEVNNDIAKEEESIKKYSYYLNFNKSDLMELNTAFNKYMNADEGSKSVENKVIEIGNKIEEKEKELGDYPDIVETDIKIQDELMKIQDNDKKEKKNKNKLFIYIWAISILFSIGALVFAIISYPLLYLLFGSCLIVAIIFFILWIKEDKKDKYSANNIDKLLLEINMNSLEEYNSKKTLINSLKSEIETLNSFIIKDIEEKEKYSSIAKENINAINNILVITEIKEEDWISDTNILEKFISEYDNYSDAVNRAEIFKGKADSIMKEIEGVLHQIEDYTDTSKIYLAKAYKIIDELIVGNEKIAKEANLLKAELVKKESFKKSKLVYSGENITKFKNEADESKINYEVLQREKELEKITLETEIKTILGDNEDIHKIKEELYLLEQQKKQMLVNSESLEMAIDFIKESAQEVQKDFVPKLNKKMSEYISYITEGKYNELKVDKELTIRLIDSRSSKVVEPENLSGGTLLQVYLALRLSVAELIEKNEEKVPLFLDEIFGSYDNSRIEGTLKILGKIINERQIFIFTCKEREKEQAINEFNNKIKVIDLEIVS